MLITYKFADGQSIDLDVTEEVGTFYLSSVKAEKANTRRATRPDRHASLESFVYEDARFFDTGVDLLQDFIESETINQAMAHLTKRQQYLIKKCSIEGWSYTDLAKLEGKNEAAIRHAVNRAKEKLKKMLS